MKRRLKLLNVLFPEFCLCITVCWKLELLGNQEMTAAVAVTLLARTQDGPRGASFPMIMVQAASFDVLRLTVTERTLIRWGCNKTKT